MPELLFDEMTELKPTYRQTRDYQNRAIDAIVRRFDAGDKSTLCVMPTGTGKTVTFGFLIRRMVRDNGIRALVLAHRGELIEQAADTLGELGLTVAVEKAESRARALGDPHAVIATVQTMQGKRLETWPRDYFGLIVTDEAHHATADTYQNIYRHFRGTPHLGVTATADRGDKVNLGCVYQSVAYEYTLLDAMTAEEPGPYLCRLEVTQCDLPIDLREIRTIGGDLNAKDLEEALRPHVEPIANAIKREVGDRQTIVFTPDVGSAMAIASACESLGMVATYASGDDPLRANKVRDFRQGRVQVLANCNLLTEGFDAPNTSAIVMCRPTKSRALFAQMIGRGTRIAPGKENCIIVDFDWICGRHKLVKPVELLVTQMTGDDEDEDRIQARAQKLLDTGEEPDLMEAIAQAKRDIEAQDAARRRQIELRVSERDIQYRRVKYDPLAGYNAVGLPKSFPREITPVAASEKQVAALKRLGVPVGDDISKRRATMMLNVLGKRIEAGLASLKQVNVLIAHGFSPAEANKMPFAVASEHIGRIFGERRKA